MYGEKAAPKNRPTVRADRPHAPIAPTGEIRPPARVQTPVVRLALEHAVLARHHIAQRSSDASASAAPSKQAPVVIPPPISDSEIAKLSHDAAMKEWTSRKAHATQPGIDEAIKRRLIDESEKAKARMQEAGQGDGK